MNIALPLPRTFRPSDPHVALPECLLGCGETNAPRLEDDMRTLGNAEAKSARVRAGSFADRDERRPAESSADDPVESTLTLFLNALMRALAVWHT
jgi:hypothetical protein